MKVYCNPDAQESGFLQGGLHIFTLTCSELEIKLLVRTGEGAEELVLERKYKCALGEREWTLSNAELAKEADWALDGVTLVTDKMYPKQNIQGRVLDVDVDRDCIDLLRKGSRVRQGIIGKETKVEWASSKSRVLLTLLLTEEMFQIDESSGSLMYERFAQHLLMDLLDMWIKEESQHKFKILILVPSIDGLHHVAELSNWKNARDLQSELRVKQECAAVKRIYEQLPKLTKVDLQSALRAAWAMCPTRFDPTVVNTGLVLFVSGDLTGSIEPMGDLSLQIVNLTDKSAPVEQTWFQYHAVGEGGHSRQSSRTNVETENAPVVRKRFSIDTMTYMPIIRESQAAKEERITIMWGRSFHEQLKKLQVLLPNGERRLNLVMIPSKDPPYHRIILDSAKNEKLDDEELRIAGFYHFCEQLLKTMQVAPSMFTGVEQLGIMLSTSSASQFGWSELKRREEEIQNKQRMLNELPEERTTPKIIKDSIEGVMPLTKSSDPSLIAAMMQNALIGVGLKNRRWHLTMYKNVLVGHDAVDWFLKFFEDIGTREEAMALGQSLMDRNVISHVLKGHQFLDGYYYYQFTDDYRSGGKYVKESMVLEPMTLAKGLEKMKQDSRVPMVLCIKTLDEGVELHYDAVQNPSVTFHMTLLWNADHDAQVREMYEFIKEKAKLCGFELAVQMLDLNVVDDVVEEVKDYYLDMEPDESYPPSDRMQRTLSIFEENHDYLYVDQFGNNWLQVLKDADGNFIKAVRIRNPLAE